MAWPVHRGQDRGSDQRQGSRDQASHDPRKAPHRCRLSCETNSPGWSALAHGSWQRSYTAHNADGPSSLATYDGAQMRAAGVLGGSIPYSVWISGGR